MRTSPQNLYKVCRILLLQTISVCFCSNILWPRALWHRAAFCHAITIAPTAFLTSLGPSALGGMALVRINLHWTNICLYQVKEGLFLGCRHRPKIYPRFVGFSYSKQYPSSFIPIFFGQRHYGIV
jgi:hypothetical protein